jgi:anti-sigma factor RsiW
MSEPIAPEELDALLSAHLDGELDAEAELRLGALLARPEVAARLEALRGVDAALRAVPEPAVPSALLARVREAAGTASGVDSVARATPPRRRRWLRNAALAAAVAALALWIASLGDRRSAEERAPIARTPAPEPTPLEVAATPELLDEDVALAVSVESLDDLELLENLELLEQLGELEDWG